MKRKNFRNRVMVFPAPFVRPIADRREDLARLSFRNGQSGPHTRKIFVIKQVRCPFSCRSGQALPGTNAAGKTIRRILIFDDHPESLRLVFGGGANPHGDLSVPQRVSSWELILVSILTMGALIGTFWPLF